MGLRAELFLRKDWPHVLLLIFKRMRKKCSWDYLTLSKENFSSVISPPFLSIHFLKPSLIFEWIMMKSPLKWGAARCQPKQEELFSEKWKPQEQSKFKMERVKLVWRAHEALIWILGSFKHNSRNQVHFKFVIYRQLFHIDEPKEQEFRVKISNLELLRSWKSRIL